MGRPFEKELLNVESTLSWALDQKVVDLKNIILANSDKPFYVVGSGGSFSACHYVADLLQYHGFFAKAITPLYIHQKRVRIFNTNLIFISASGRNTDILSSYESAVSQDPNIAISISLKVDSPLKKLSMEYSIGKHYEFDLPTGKDGFLATNSLIAFFALLNEAVSKEKKREDTSSQSVSETQLSQIRFFVKKNFSKKTFIVLYGSWGSSVAIDLESKFSEAALGNVLLSDYRNFGHGRHHWFDKQAKDSAIIMLITPSEEKLANRTIDILPKSIPHLKLQVDDTTSNGSMSLLIQSFHFVNEIGKRKKIDPGRPGVPPYGSKLYNLKYKTLLKSSRDFTSQQYLAISRKVQTPELLNEEELHLWNSGLKEFIKLLSITRFGGIIFDYDGTLCSSENRYKGMSSEISKAINKIVEKGLIVGVATGRGKSVREDFQNQVPQKYWDQIVIGYYNGSDIGMLSDVKIPDSTTEPHESLTLIAKRIEEHPLLKQKLEMELRPFQLTIKIANKIEWQYIRRIIAHILMTMNLPDIQMLESSHSCDIVVKTKASKLNILPICNEIAAKFNCSQEFLCIGDRGQWPGNDFELLSHRYSLSVDEVSPDIASCWNLADAGKRNTEATLDYLSKIKWRNSDHSFSLVL